MQDFEASAEEADTGTTPAGLYRLYASHLRRLLLGLLRNQADADDALQQVFLKLLDGWDSIQPESVKGWLFTVAYREAMTVRRRQRRDGKALAELLQRPVWSQRVLPRPEQRVADQETLQAVRDALGGLPDEQRDVVERRIHGNQTFASIAQELGCPLGTVLTRMRLALQKLKHLAEE